MEQRRDAVKWAELFPDQLKARIEQRPVVYLPMGLCEPHGHIAVLGLDTIKAEYLCVEAATRWGGVVAPTQGYQIHEVGFHAPWLADVVGNVNAYMTSIPTGPMLYFFLYQLRAFHNAGFKLVIVITGHSGGNQHDFRLAAEEFMRATDMVVNVFSDPELTQGQFSGDHAGKYEISQLLYLHSEFVDLKSIGKWQNDHPETRFAQGEDAEEATAEFGNVIMEKCLHGIHQTLKRHEDAAADRIERTIMSFDTVETVWQKLKDRFDEWITPRIKTDQVSAEENSIWRPFEKYQIK
jgi:creatinine amidohydrolase